jgi:hypothetical protein
MTKDPTQPLRLEDFRTDVEQLSLEDLSSRHGGAYFVHHGSMDAMQPAMRPGQTAIVEGAPIGPGRAATPKSAYLVYPVKQTGRSPFPNFISVGRTANNDVVIVDASLSKFHAYIRTDTHGDFAIQDAGSRNGTFVDDAPVPAKEKGAPVGLRSGARVRFGRIELIFLAADQFRSMVKLVLKV